MMRARRLTFLLLIPLLPAGCASFPDHLNREWQCSASATVGDVVALSFRDLKPDGTAATSSHSWEWRRRGEDADVLFHQQSSMDEGRPWIVVNPGKSLRPRIVGVELRTGPDQAAATGARMAVRGRQWQYILDPDLEDLLALPRPVVVAGYDREGRTVLRVALDLDAAKRGAEAVARAEALSLEATRDFRRTCRHPSDDPLVIA